MDRDKILTALVENTEQLLLQNDKIIERLNILIQIFTQDETD